MRASCEVFVRLLDKRLGGMPGPQAGRAQAPRAPSPHSASVQQRPAHVDQLVAGGKGHHHVHEVDELGAHRRSGSDACNGARGAHKLVKKFCARLRAGAGAALPSPCRGALRAAQRHA